MHIKKPVHSTQVKRPMCVKCIDRGVGTSSLLMTASVNGMMNWEEAAAAVAKTKEHLALSSREFRYQ
jgi:hypothetical protein